MRTRWSQVATFFAGSVTAVAFLAYCGGTVAAKGDADGGVADASTPGTGGDGARLKLYRHHAVDGLDAIVPGRYYDSSGKTVCSLGNAADGKMRCLWGEGPFQTIYGDSECKVPLLTTPGLTCATFAQWPQRPDEDCNRPPPVHVYRLGAAHQGPVYDLESGPCTEQPTKYARFSTFERGEEIAPGAFVEMSLTHD